MNLLQGMVIGGVTLAMFISAAFGQLLSIENRGDGRLRIEAVTLPNARYALQASANLALWVDIQDEVSNQTVYQFEPLGSRARYFRLASRSGSPDPVVVMLIGDSTASDCCGWGQSIYGYFKPEARVVNYAMPYTSTRLFLHSAELDKMLAVKPDYVLIQFGFVDTALWDPDRGTTLSQFATNLQAIVQMIRDFEGKPILITPHVARMWDAGGRVIPAWQDRCQIVKAVSEEMGAHFIDLNQLTTALYNELGESGSRFMINLGVPDTVHFSPEGARVVSGLVVNALPPVLGPYLKGIFEIMPSP